MINRIGGTVSIQYSAVAKTGYKCNSQSGSKPEQEQTQKSDSTEEKSSQIADFAEKMNKDADSFRLNSITNKLSSGKKLSYCELSYLRQKDAALYARAKSIQDERKAAVRRLKQCKSKAELRSYQHSKIISISSGFQPKGTCEYNQDLSARIANTNDVCLEYRKTHKLPENAGRPRYDRITLSRGRKNKI